MTPPRRDAAKDATDPARSRARSATGVPVHSAPFVRGRKRWDPPRAAAPECSTRSAFGLRPITEEGARPAWLDSRRLPLSNRTDARTQRGANARSAMSASRELVAGVVLQGRY